MRTRFSRCIRLTLVVGALLGVTPASVSAFAAPQSQTNLLTNPGFEDGWYHWNNVGEISVPNGWDFWYATEAVPMLEPQDIPWGRPEVVTWVYPAGFAETWFWRDGQHTLKAFGAWRPIWFRLSQTVSGLTPGVEYKFVAPVFPESVAEYVAGGTRGRVFSDDPLAGEFTLSATSGGQAFSSGWVNETVAPPWQWTLLSLNFVAQTDSATVEVEVRGRWGLVNNAFFLDELSLTPTGNTGEVSASPPAESGGGGEAAPTAVEAGGTAQGQAAPAPAGPVWGYTSTPLPNGEIWWEVRSGDTLAVIAYYHDTTPESIKELNGLSSNVIYPGQQLLIKRVTPPSTATAEPAQTATPAPSSTPTQSSGAASPAEQPALAEPAAASANASANLPEYGEVCVLTYDDVNANAENDEEGRVDGAHVVLINENGPLDSRTSGRSRGETECFQRLAPGAYRVAVLAPTGFRLTTADAADVVLQSGSIVTLAFGMTPAGVEEAQVTANRTSTMYALGAGAVLLISAGVVGISLVARRRR